MRVQVVTNVAAEGGHDYDDTQNRPHRKRRGCRDRSVHVIVRGMVEGPHVAHRRCKRRPLWIWLAHREQRGARARGLSERHAFNCSAVSAAEIFTYDVSTQPMRCPRSRRASPRRSLELAPTAAASCSGGCRPCRRFDPPRRRHPYAQYRPDFTDLMDGSMRGCTTLLIDGRPEVPAARALNRRAVADSAADGPHDQPLAQVRGVDPRRPTCRRRSTRRAAKRANEPVNASSSCSTSRNSRPSPLRRRRC